MSKRLSGVAVDAVLIGIRCNNKKGELDKKDNLLPNIDYSKIS